MRKKNEIGGPEAATLGAIGFMREQKVSLAGMSGRSVENSVSTATGARDDGKETAGIERVRADYDSLVESILSGNRKAGESIAQLFTSLTGGGKQAKQALAGVFEGMAGQIFESMGDYAKRLGVLTGLSAKAFAALRSMNPFAAAAASVGLIALGQALKSLAGSLGKGGGKQAGSGSGPGYAQAAATSAASSVSPSAQPLNIYIGGLRGTGAYELDRALNRAGVDRELRERFRELVRTGSNPAVGR